MLTEHISLFIPYHLIVNTRKSFILSHLTKALAKANMILGLMKRYFAFLF